MPSSPHIPDAKKRGQSKKTASKEEKSEVLNFIGGMSRAVLDRAIEQYKKWQEYDAIEIEYPAYEFPKFHLFHCGDVRGIWGRVLLAIAFEQELRRILNQQALNGASDERLRLKLVEDFDLEITKLRDSAERARWVENTKDYWEGKRGVREASFYNRNPELARRVKERDGFTCRCCGLKGNEHYEMGGERSIEAHHEKAFCDRPEIEKLKNAPTKIVDMFSLCANCHRVAHSERPALSLAKLKARLKVPIDC